VPLAVSSSPTATAISRFHEPREAVIFATATALGAAEAVFVVVGYVCVHALAFAGCDAVVCVRLDEEPFVTFFFMSDVCARGERYRRRRRRRPWTWTIWTNSPKTRSAQRWA
jgi:hypothetical protein